MAALDPATAESSAWRRLLAALGIPAEPAASPHAAPCNRSNTGIAVEILDLTATPVAGDICPGVEPDRSGRRLLDDLIDEFSDVLGWEPSACGATVLAFHPPRESTSFAFRVLAAQGHLLPLLAAYLLRRHHLRVLPDPGAPWCLPFRWPDRATPDQELRWRTALRDVCEKVRAGDWPELSAPLLDGPACETDSLIRCHAPSRLCVFDERRWVRQQQHIPPRRVAWLCHLVDVDDLTRQEPRLVDWPFAQRERLLERFTPLVGPVIMSGVDVRPRAGESVRLYPILLPFSSRMARRWLDTRRWDIPRGLIREGLDVAHQLGCSVVSLGQYNSILSQDGRWVVAHDQAIGADGPLGSLRVSSGNSYTVALAVAAVEQQLTAQGREPSECTLAVAGALGNIGSICVHLLAPRFRRVLLLGSGRKSGQHRLARLAATFPHATALDDPRSLVSADVVVSAVSADTPPFGAEHFGPSALVCDISVPRSVRADTAELRPDLLIFRGGIGRLPHGEDLEIASYPLPPGQVFGCLAEALLLGWDGTSNEHYIGPVTVERVQRTRALAEQFGMIPGELKRDCVLGSDVRESAYDSV